MAGAGYRLFNTGDVLTAAQVNTFLQEQVVMVFANATARTTALSGVLAEGMMSYLQDTNAVEVYNGSAWVSVGSTGDITEVTTAANSGLTGGATSGAVALRVNTTAKGSIIAGTGATTLGELTVGANNTVLTADSSTATGLKWATPASTNSMTLLSTTTLSGAATTVSSISGSYKTLVIFMKDFSPNSDVAPRIRLNGDATAANYQQTVLRAFGSTNNPYADNAGAGADLTGYVQDASSHDAFSYIVIPDYANTTTRKIVSIQTSFNEGSNNKAVLFNTTNYTSTSAITSLEFNAGASTWAGGSVEIYGVN